MKLSHVYFARLTCSPEQVRKRSNIKGFWAHLFTCASLTGNGKCTTEEVTALTIDDLIVAEPSLRAVIDRAAEARRQPYRQRLGAYSAAKREAESLVGFGSPVPELQTGEAWEALTRTLSDVLDI